MTTSAQSTAPPQEIKKTEHKPSAFALSRNVWATGIFIIVLALLPLLPIPEFWVTLLNYIGLSSLVTLGLMLLTGVGGMTSFGQAAFVGLGAYSTAYLSLHGHSPWLGLLAGIAITTVCAFMLGLLTMRMKGHYLPLATIAWGLALYYLFGNQQFLGNNDGLSDIPVLDLFGIHLSTGRDMYYLIWFSVLVAILAILNLLNSRPGRGIRALRGGTIMAEAMGVNTGWMKVVIFVFAAVLASISGFLYAHLQRNVNPTPFGLDYGIEYLFMTVIGGVGHVWGAVLGAGLLTVLKNVLQDVLPKLFGDNGNYEMIILGILLVLLLQFARFGVWSFVRKAFPLPKPCALAPDTAPALHRRQKPQAGSQMLQVQAVRKQFGGLVAVNDVSFEVKAGEIVGLIGPNGAGKSTTFNLITGVAGVSNGQVQFCGETISNLPSRTIVKRGVGRTFQHVQLLAGMTVLENVALGAHLRGDFAAQGGVFASILRLNKREEHKLLYEARVQLERVGFGDRLYKDAGSLSLGEQRIMEIARALCCDPILLLLDEPAAGLRYLEKQALAELITKLKAEGMSVLLVEHDMDFVMNITDRLVVMEFGTKIAEGIPSEVQQNPAVLDAYLGGID